MVTAKQVQSVYSLRQSTIWLIGNDEPLITRTRQLLADQVQAVQQWDRWQKVLEIIGQTTTSANCPQLILGFCSTHDPKLPKVFRQLRHQCQAPIVLVIPNTMDLYIPQYIYSGADDFLVIPFGPQTLLIRLKIALKRYVPAPAEPHPFYCDDYLTIDPAWHQAIVAGDFVACTAVEMKILSVLVQNRNRTVPYEMIIEAVWGHDSNHSTGDLHRYISKLRHKLEQDPRHPRYLLTHYGIGYSFHSQM